MVCSRGVHLRRHLLPLRTGDLHLLLCGDQLLLRFLHHRFGGIALALHLAQLFLRLPDGRLHRLTLVEGNRCALLRLLQPSRTLARIQLCEQLSCLHMVAWVGSHLHQPAFRTCHNLRVVIGDDRTSIGDAGGEPSKTRFLNCYWH